jgi:MFS family permease
MADWWGRRTPIAVGCVLMIIGGLIGTFANGYGSKYKSISPLYFGSHSRINFNSLSVYVGGRFVLGFGNSLAQMSSPVLLTEICHPQHRGKVTAIYNCLWNLGALCKIPPLQALVHGKLTSI